MALEDEKKIAFNTDRTALKDEKKITFNTDRGLYCYRIMLSGLKNAGVTYKYLVNIIFKDQIS